MITVSIGNEKKVLTICYDKASGKYRSIDIGKRSIAAQQYDKPSDVIASLERLKEKGKIKGFVVMEEVVDE